jgi:DNA-binding IclR family transcriptional regulator
MTSISPGPLPLHAEAASVLAALSAESNPLGLRLNDLTATTNLPTGHVGRHLRTLEADRLASFGAGRWRLTLRGRRIAGELAATPIAA